MQGHEAGDFFELDYNATRHIIHIMQSKESENSTQKTYIKCLELFFFWFKFFFEIFPSILIKDENNQTLRSQFDNNNPTIYICILMSFLPCQQQR